ncbi:MAG: hypothetical protein Q8Q94_01235 [bacterium]|nr:hypothetical protein [bacterium]
MAKMKLPEKEFLWTSELAYAVGLLVTDGCLSKDGRHIIMRSSETEQLKTFRRCLGIQNKMAVSHNNGYATKPSYRVQFGNIQFYNWLLTIGLFPAKTYTIGKIKIPDDYFADFLRGHLDGDGSISTYTDYYNTYKNPKYTYTRLFVRFLSASQEHMEWIQKNMERIFAIKGHLNEEKPTRKDQTTSMWQLKFAKKDSINLLSWMYYQEGLPCLQRKWMIAQNTLAIFSTEKRREYTRASESSTLPSPTK